MTSDRPSLRSVIVHFLPAIAVMAGIFTLSNRPTVPELPGPFSSYTSIIGHFSVYLVLTLTIWWALRSFNLTRKQRFALAFSAAILYAVTDEWHQSFVPGRTPDLRDILVDALGAAAALGIASLLLRTGVLPAHWE